jgi:hypothetical protein
MLPWNQDLPASGVGTGLRKITKREVGANFGELDSEIAIRISCVRKGTSFVQVLPFCNVVMQFNHSFIFPQILPLAQSKLFNS